MRKTLSKSGVEGNFLKALCEKSIANIILNGKILKASFYISSIARCPLLEFVSTLPWKSSQACTIKQGVESRGEKVYRLERKKSNVFSLR